ncbi:hypothetical protein CRE_25250 [Caenorhabditis remanei]|uniref:Uncharacterized protein n=1 Tax=Caenorhabditis remanei TaxID=31234 RepID=E3LS58_CAERE|nr:hypothetical protein CRE_25250 [Caenorhabditis remanei]
MSSNAEAMATDFEQTGGPDLSSGTGKRTKSERAEHKHSSQPGGDTRKVVQTASNGEAKRKEKWLVGVTSSAVFIVVFADQSFNSLFQIHSTQHQSLPHLRPTAN